MTEAAAAFLEELAHDPRPEAEVKLPVLLNQAVQAEADSVEVARRLARLTDTITVVVDFRLDGPMTSRLRIPLSTLPPGDQQQLVSILLGVVKASGGDASFKTLIEHLPG